ncbi:MAG TPA: hypothetical protein VNG71_05395 [Pyrinomonadaceae bacterium]|nr:hypothetical protein [Pyrinomonadaceae bacterium]
MSHLESLIAEYLEWQGCLVKRNLKVGRRDRGGWEMELDVVGLNPKTQTIIHYEPSLDALTWDKREPRYEKKFKLSKKYMFKEVFDWLPKSTHIEQIAVFYNHPAGRDTIAGAKIMSIDELMAEIRGKVCNRGPMIKNAISEHYPLLRTIQMSHVGYCRAIQVSD